MNSDHQAEASSGGPIVRLAGVNKHYGALHVLNNINLDVVKGEVVVILGPSGSGKSTLCRTINRLETIDEGTITIDIDLSIVDGLEPIDGAAQG